MAKGRYIMYVGECRYNYRRIYYMWVYIFLSRIYYYCDKYLAIQRCIPGQRAYACIYRYPIIWGGWLWIYSSMCHGTCTYANIRGWVLLRRKCAILSTWRSAGVTIGAYIICGFITIYYYRVYICMGANVLLLYTLHLSMYLYTEYSVCMYMDICGYGLLINGCMYELIFK
jgi:hypothetical protein